MSTRQLSIPGRPKPYVMAHRGNSAACPENTLAAFRRALADGADIIETDLHLTADGVFVCIHDGDVDRTTDGHGPVAAMTLAEVKTLSASYGRPEFAAERVPALGELCAILPADVVLALELKTDRFLEPDVCRKLADELAAARVLDRTVVLSFALGARRGSGRGRARHAQGLHHNVEAHAEGGGRPTDRRVLADLLPQPVLRPPGARGGTDHVPTGSHAGRPAVVLPLAGMRRGVGQRSRRDDPQIGAQAGTMLIVKGGFAIGRAKHKGGDSRQRKAPA